MTMRRLTIVARSAAFVASLSPLVAYAADLSFQPGDERGNAERYPAGRSYTAMQWPVYPQPRRFDIYGNPLGGFFVAGPAPLVVSNGCPKAIEPIYDIDGNLAGYTPFVACR